MISVNSRAFQDKAKLWILTHADFTDYDLHPNMDSFHEMACAVCTIFKRETTLAPCSHVEDWCNFIAWCEGLPTCLHTWDFLNTNAGELLWQDWTEATSEEYSMNGTNETFAEQLIICEIYKAISIEYEKEMKKR